MDVLFAGRFAAFPRQAFTFFEGLASHFEGLASHNTREWFQAPFIASAVGSRYYTALSRDGLYVGTGFYMPDGATLRRLREAIAADASGRKIASIVSALKQTRYSVGSHETLPKAPRGSTPIIRVSSCSA